VIGIRVLVAAPVPARRAASQPLRATPCGLAVHEKPLQTRGDIAAG
jgi:hypothetical protein